MSLDLSLAHYVILYDLTFERYMTCIKYIITVEPFNIKLC